MIIKSITKGPWGEKQHTATTWYEPFEDMETIQKGVNFSLSYDVTGVCTAADTRILPLMLQACENFRHLTSDEIEALIKSGEQYQPLFA